MQFQTYNQQHGYGVPQLPFPIDRLVNAPIYVQPGQSPVPLNIPCHPNLQPYLPLIGSSIVEVIQGRAQENQLRVFAYNLVSQNNYNNEDFLLLCTVLCNYVELSMAKNQYRDIQSAILDGAHKVVEMFAAQQLQRFPQLQQMIDQQLLMRCQPVFNIINAFSNELANYKRMQQQQMTQYQQPYGNQPYGNQPYGNAPQSWVGNQVPSNNQNFYGQNQSSSPFSSGGYTPTRNPDLGAYQSNDFYTPRKENMTEQTQREPVQRMPEPVNQPTQPALAIPAGKIVKADEVKWVPSTKYPYNIVYDASKYELYYIIEDDGAMKPSLRPITKEKEMEREKHFKMPYTQGSQQRADALLTELQSSSISGSPEAKLSVSTDAEHKDIDLVTRVDVHKSGIADEELWIEVEAKLHARKPSESRKPNAQLLLGYMVTPFVSEIDPRNFVDQLLNAKNFIEATGILKDAAALLDQNVKNPLVNAHALNFIDNRLTTMLNDFVHKNLALDITIKSFMEDAVELITYLETKKGSQFSNPLRAAQQVILRDALCYAMEDSHRNLLEYYVADAVLDLNKKPQVTFFGHTDMFVAVNLFFSDLNLGISSGNISVAVFEDQHPLMYNIAHRIFLVERDVEEHFNRRLIRTLDRKIIEVYRSELDHETYLISVQ